MARQQTTKARNQRPTRLEAFITVNKVGLAELESKCGLSRTCLYQLRLGIGNPRLSNIAAVVCALRDITQRPVEVDEVFEIAPLPQRRSA
jgi:predicted transcriptional regulator